MAFHDWYTTEGKKVLRNRLENLMQVYANLDQPYPVTLQALGFPPLELNSREELHARIKELSDILHVTVEVGITTTIKEEEE